MQGSGALPGALSALLLEEEAFAERFELIHEIEDPYVRVYEISRDLSTARRVAVRSYTAAEQGQEHDVLENMESFRKLGDEEGMCRLLAFTRKQAGIISAAFEYDDFSLEELLQTRHYHRERHALYLLVLREVLHIVASANAAGIVIEELIPACILLQTAPHFALKILYDEREKRYDKIQEGAKVLASPEKMAIVINELRDYDSTDCEEAVFELGLLLLDFAYEFESQPAPEDEVFARDSPLARHGLAHSYLTFRDAQGATQVALDRSLIDRKIAFLTALNVPFITRLLALIRRMIEPVASRITFEEASEEAELLSELLEEASSQAARESEGRHENPYATPGKESPGARESLSAARESVSAEREMTRREGEEVKKVISQTTIASPKFTSTTDHRYQPISEGSHFNNWGSG